VTEEEPCSNAEGLCNAATEAGVLSIIVSVMVEEMPVTVTVVVKATAMLPAESEAWELVATLLEVGGIVLPSEEVEIDALVSIMLEEVEGDGDAWLLEVVLCNSEVDEL
jgi:hypothetical protein